MIMLAAGEIMYAMRGRSEIGLSAPPARPVAIMTPLLRRYIQFMPCLVEGDMEAGGLESTMVSVGSISRIRGERW
jgi:hypothetical protein